MWRDFIRRKVAGALGFGKKGSLLEELLLRGTQTAAGVHVSPDSAMRIATVFSCVGVLAETVAQLPIRIYRKTATAREEVRDHPLWRLLATAPNSWQTSFEFREMMMQHLCLRGNFYALKVFDNKGIVRELLPLNPDCVSVKQNPDWSITYTVTDSKAGYLHYGNGEILHVRYRTLDGVTGISPVAYNRETFGMAIAEIRHGANLYRNGGKPGGVLEHPGQLSKEAHERLKASWEHDYGGMNAGKTAVLEEGMSYKPLTMTQADAQYIETRQLTIEEIARIYRVPLHEIQSTRKSTTWGSGIEAMNIGFTTRTILPWLRRIEEAEVRDLLPPGDRENIQIKYIVEGLLRGDKKTRYEVYGIGIDKGLLCPNEVRALEDMNPREGGDTYLTPLNMRESGSLGGEDPGDEEPDETDD